MLEEISMMFLKLVSIFKNQTGFRFEGESCVRYIMGQLDSFGIFITCTNQTLPQCPEEGRPSSYLPNFRSSADASFSYSTEGNRLREAALRSDRKNKRPITSLEKRVQRLRKMLRKDRSDRRNLRPS
jgi:hypothetical protein